MFQRTGKIDKQNDPVWLEYRHEFLVMTGMVLDEAPTHEFMAQVAKVDALNNRVSEIKSILFEYREMELMAEAEEAVAVAG